MKLSLNRSHEIETKTFFEQLLNAVIPELRWPVDKLKK